MTDVLLPELSPQELKITQAYLRDVALVLGKFQQVFLPPNEYQWQYGLIVTESGLATQPFELHGEQVQAVLDMKVGMMRLGAASWPLADYSALELFNNCKVWLETRRVKGAMATPHFATTTADYDPLQASAIADIFWWVSNACINQKAHYKQGVISPILVFPHHFDLSLVWFPHDDKRQIALGFSLGGGSDDAIATPYVYCTMYPEAEPAPALQITAPAYEQTTGFHGAILGYDDLRTSRDPQVLFSDFAQEATKQFEALLIK
jgi:hypothetical protein